MVVSRARMTQEAPFTFLVIPSLHHHYDNFLADGHESVLRKQGPFLYDLYKVTILASKGSVIQDLLGCLYLFASPPWGPLPGPVPQLFPPPSPPLLV